MPVSKAALRKASRRTSSEGRFAASRTSLRMMAPSVSVPVLSVQRMSMLPRFSMASRRRTMTPRLLIARAPADKGHADDRRQQFRRQPHRQRHGEQQRLDRRPAEQQVHRQHEEDDDDHDPDQQVAELPDATREVRLGRPCPQPGGDGAELGPTAGPDDEDLRRAAAHRGAEKDRIGPSRRSVHRPRTIPGRFSTGNGLARHAGLADEEVLRLDHESVGGDQVARRQQDQIAGHDQCPPAPPVRRRRAPRGTSVRGASSAPRQRWRPGTPERS